MIKSIICSILSLMLLVGAFSSTPAFAYTTATSKVSTSHKAIPIWSSKPGSTPAQNALDHWKKHRKEFPELRDVKQYIQKAHQFIARPPLGTLKKIRKNGEIVLFHPKTNTFGAYQKNGVPKTLFRPNPSKHRYKNNLEYFYGK